MTDQITELAKLRYIPNIVIRVLSTYFAIRQPDSGLVVPASHRGLVRSLNLNPTSIDPYNATTTQNQNSFSLLDNAQVVTALFNANLQYFQGEKVEIWIGRSGVSMDFADYMKLNDTYITKVSRQDSAYNFQCKEAKERLATGAFDTRGKLGASILAATTVITMQDASMMPTSGTFKLNDEFISYTGIIGNNLQSCIRGEQGTTPADHAYGDDLYLCQVLQDNPVTLLLQLMISSGGGGVYDVLDDGAAIDQNLVDIDQIEALRDEYFSDRVFKLIFFNIDSLKKEVERHILYPLRVRLRAQNNGKIGLALMDKPTINLDAPDLTHDNITKTPVFEVDETKITNVLRIEYDYNWSTDKYESLAEYTDADSIAQFGESKPYTVSFKGVRTTLGGVAFNEDFQDLFFRRFAFPKPTVSFNSHMRTSVWELGEKPYVETTHIPTTSGDLNFADNLELISRAINHETGDITLKLSFNAFTGLRACFIAPSDTIATVTNQKTITVGAGRGENYRVGWIMKLYNNTTRDYAATETNEIESITGDTIVFVNNWVTTLVATTHRMMFADYNQVSDQQKKFCFISDDGNNFTDGKPAFVISF